MVVYLNGSGNELPSYPSDSKPPPNLGQDAAHTTTAASYFEELRQHMIAFEQIIETLENLENKQAQLHAKSKQVTLAKLIKASRTPKDVKMQIELQVAALEAQQDAIDRAGQFATEQAQQIRRLCPLMRASLESEMTAKVEGIYHTLYDAHHWSAQILGARTQGRVPKGDRIAEIIEDLNLLLTWRALSVEKELYCKEQINALRQNKAQLRILHLLEMNLIMGATHCTSASLRKDMEMIAEIVASVKGYYQSGFSGLPVPAPLYDWEADEKETTLVPPGVDQLSSQLTSLLEATVFPAELVEQPPEAPPEEPPEQPKEEEEEPKPVETPKEEPKVKKDRSKLRKVRLEKNDHHEFHSGHQTKTKGALKSSALRTSKRVGGSFRKSVTSEHVSFGGDETRTYRPSVDKTAEAERETTTGQTSSSSSEAGPTSIEEPAEGEVVPIASLEGVAAAGETAAAALGDVFSPLADAAFAPAPPEDPAVQDDQETW